MTPRLVGVPPPFRRNGPFAGANPEVKESALLQLATWLALVSAEAIEQAPTPRIDLEALPRDESPSPRDPRPRSPG